MQNTLSIYCCDTDKKVFYRTIQGKYTIDLYSRLTCQLHITYKLFIADFCQSSKYYLAKVLIVEDFLFFQATHYL